MMKAANFRKRTKAAPSYIKWFHEIGIEDVPIVGGKTASLGEMFRELTPKGVEMSDGFAITAAGYWHSNAGRTVFQTTRAILKTEKQS